LHRRPYFDGQAVRTHVLRALLGQVDVVLEVVFSGRSGLRICLPGNPMAPSEDRSGSNERLDPPPRIIRNPVERGGSKNAKQTSMPGRRAALSRRAPVTDVCRGLGVTDGCSRARSRIWKRMVRRFSLVQLGPKPVPGDYFRTTASPCRNVAPTPIPERNSCGAR